MIEIDENVINKSYIFVDSIHAFYCGDLYNYFNKNDEETINKYKTNKWREIGEYISNEIGDNLNKKENGKPINNKYENEITLYESVGVAAQDLHSAYFVYQNAIDKHIGTDVCL